MEGEEIGDAIGATSLESVKEAKPVRISYHLIAKRNLPLEDKGEDQEDVLAALNDITHLRLDRENIREIDSLELLGPDLTNIYLQHNVIEKIENLECVKNVQFLVLAGNRIKVVENLVHLTKLYFLDLSENLIADFDIDEFPQSLLMLDLRGNPCVHTKDYRGRVLQDLANLTHLDGEEVTAQEKLEVGFAPEASSEEEQEQEEEEEAGAASGLGELDNYAGLAPDQDNQELDMADRGRIRAFIFGKEPVLPDLGSSLQSLREDMIRRSELRRQEVQMVHDQRREDLEALLQSVSRPPSAFSPRPPSQLGMAPPSQLPSLSSPPQVSARPPSQK